MPWKKNVSQKAWHDKLSRTRKNLTSKKSQLITLDVQTKANPPANYPSLWYIRSELLSNSDGIHEKVEKPSNTKQSEINLRQRLEQVQLQKKIAFKYQSQKVDKNSQNQLIYPQETCIIMRDLILKGLIEENLSKQQKSEPLFWNMYMKYLFLMNMYFSEKNFLRSV